MGANKRGVRTGDGPYKGSYQRKTKGSVGKRRAGGQKCPKGRKR